MYHCLGCHKNSGDPYPGKEIRCECGCQYAILLEDEYITILDVAQSWGIQSDESGIPFSEFERLGLPPMGGCLGCSASIAAYNSFPSKMGYLKCKDCIHDDHDGFFNVVDFERWTEGRMN